MHDERMTEREFNPPIVLDPAEETVILRLDPTTPGAPRAYYSSRGGPADEETLAFRRPPGFGRARWR